MKYVSHNLALPLKANLLTGNKYITVNSIVFEFVLCYRIITVGINVCRRHEPVFKFKVETIM